MRRSARLSEKQAKPANKDQMEPKAKKKRSGNRISTIATFDNGTMVEAFKFFNYYQLAKNSLVSKRFFNLICTHRHKLAFLYVAGIGMSDFYPGPSFIEIFDQKLSPGDYKEWVSDNGYSKQIPIEGQVVEKQSAQYGRKVYVLRAFAGYNGNTSVFYAKTKLIHKYWPVFQHFVRLLMDPFIYIQDMEFIPQNDVFNLLAGALNQASNRLRCKKLELNFKGDFPKFINWAKNNICCNEFLIDNTTNYNEELFDLMVSGAHCTSEISIDYCIPSRVVIDFVQKFADFKSSEECQVVESIRCDVTHQSSDVLKRDYADFIVKEERNEDDGSTERVFEFVNSDVRKKLQITDKNFESCSSLAAKGAGFPNCLITLNDMYGSLRLSFRLFQLGTLQTCYGPV